MAPSRRSPNWRLALDGRTGRAWASAVFGAVTTGAANDLQRATRLGRDMVCNYGMSDVVGPVSFDEEQGDIFLGRDYLQRKTYSEKTAELIDGEVKTLLTTLYAEAKSLIAENRVALDRIALALLERETLEGAELQLLLKGEPLPAMRVPAAPTKPGPPPERVKAEPSKTFAGEKLPDPEPVPG